MGLIYRPTIFFEDQHDADLYISLSMRAYLEKHPSKENYEEDDDYQLFTIDIEPETVKEMQAIAENDDDLKMIEMIKKYECSYINIEPHLYFIAE